MVRDTITDLGLVMGDPRPNRRKTVIDNSFTNEKNKKIPRKNKRRKQRWFRVTLKKI